MTDSAPGKPLHLVLVNIDTQDASLSQLEQALHDAEWCSLGQASADALDQDDPPIDGTDCLLLAGSELAAMPDARKRELTLRLAPCPVIVLCPDAQRHEGHWLAAGAEDCVDAYTLPADTVLRIVRRSTERAAQRVHVSTAERQYEDLFRKMPVAAFSVSANAEVTRANQAFLELIEAKSVNDVKDDHLNGLLLGLSALLARSDDTPCDYNDHHIIDTLSGQQLHVVVFARRKLTEEHPEMDVFVTDVTEKELQARRVAAAENRLRQIYDAVPVMMFTLNRELQIVGPNRSFLRLLGLEDAALTTLSLPHLIHPDVQGSNDTTPVTRIAQCKQERDLPLALLRSDGQKLECLYNASPQLDESGQVIGAHVMMVDVSERNRVARERDSLQEQLQLTQKLESIGELAAGIAHEINTPAQYVSDNLSFLRESFDDMQPLFELLAPLQAALADNGDAGAYADKLERVCEEADVEFLVEEIPAALQQGQDGISKIREIVLALKEFSHPGSGDMEMADINRVVMTTVTVARNEWKYVANIDFDLADELPSVPCFPSAISQVILNIVVNAAHAISDENAGSAGTMGEIQIVTLMPDSNTVAIRIADNGPGIPEQIRSKVFDPFFTTKEVGRGTGQGLAISRRVITEQHGGQLRLESEMGVGTVFTIELPLQQSQPAALDEAAA